MNKNPITLYAVCISVILLLLLGACQDVSQPTGSSTVELVKGTPIKASATVSPHTPNLTNTATPVPVSISSTSKALTPPALLYIADNRLYQQHTNDTAVMIADLGDEGDILSAIKVKDTVFVLRRKGIQQIEINGGKIAMTAVEFDKAPLFGGLIRTSNDDVLLYSTALDSVCSSTGFGTTIGLYRIVQGTSSTIFTTDQGYILPLGATSDQRNIYGLPIGCDPEFDRFWIISADNGEIAKNLYTWDAASKEYGEEYAAISPDARFLAFSTARFIEASKPLAYRLSVYNLDELTIERYELPHPPSHIWGGLLWSPDSQKLYFVLNPGTPYSELPNSHGLWSFDTQTGTFIQVASLVNPFTHLISISLDGQWLMLQPESEQIVTYVYLQTGEQIVIHLPSGGVSQIVR